MQTYRNNFAPAVSSSCAASAGRRQRDSIALPGDFRAERKPLVLLARHALQAS